MKGNVEQDLEVLRKAEEIQRDPERMKMIRQHIEIEKLCARRVGPNSVWLPSSNLH